MQCQMFLLLKYWIQTAAENKVEILCVWRGRCDIKWLKVNEEVCLTIYDGDILQCP